MFRMCKNSIEYSMEFFSSIEYSIESQNSMEYSKDPTKYFCMDIILRKNILKSYPFYYL